MYKIETIFYSKIVEELIIELPYLLGPEELLHFSKQNCEVGGVGICSQRVWSTCSRVVSLYNQLP
jgi:hypothetical protein